MPPQPSDDCGNACGSEYTPPTPGASETPDAALHFLPKPTVSPSHVLRLVADAIRLVTPLGPVFRGSALLAGWLCQKERSNWSVRRRICVDWRRKAAPRFVFGLLCTETGFPLAHELLVPTRRLSLSKAWYDDATRGTHASQHPKWSVGRWIHDPFCYAAAVAAVVDALHAMQPAQYASKHPKAADGPGMLIVRYHDDEGEKELVFGHAEKASNNEG